MDAKIGLLFLGSALYLFGGLMIMATLDEATGRVNRFLRRRYRRLAILILLWPLVLPVLFLPRYRAPKGATLRRHIKPFRPA